MSPPLRGMWSVDTVVGLESAAAKSAVVLVDRVLRNGEVNGSSRSLRLLRNRTVPKIAQPRATGYKRQILCGLPACGSLI